VAKTKPADLQGLNELRQVGLTGTNLNVIAPRYQKTSKNKFLDSYDYSKVTTDFSQVRNKDLVTITNYADVKLRNWIIVNPYTTESKRSIFYPVFVDEKDSLLRGSYYSFAEFDLNIKDSMTQLQAGSLLQSPSINPLKSPNSNSFLEYSVPHINDFLSNKGVFKVKNPTYWSTGLLHFDKSLTTQVKVIAKDGTDFNMTAN